MNKTEKLLWNECDFILCHGMAELVHKLVINVKRDMKCKLLMLWGLDDHNKANLHPPQMVDTLGRLNLEFYIKESINLTTICMTI